MSSAASPAVPPPPAAGPPVAPQVLEAPASWRCIDFVSDLHLQAAQPRTFAAFRRYLLGTRADAVLILGDLFEAWVGDDAADEGFERECRELLAEAARTRTVGFMAGNRDFLVGDALLQRCGLRGLADPTLLHAFGLTLLLSHGDALCLADRDYQRFRATVREPAWQSAFLAQPLARRREIAAGLRAESRQRQRGASAEEAPADLFALWADVDPDAAALWLSGSGAALLIHGHTHRPGEHALPGERRRHVLGDWEFDGPAGEPPRGDVLRLSASGLERLPASSFA